VLAAIPDALVRERLIAARRPPSLADEVPSYGEPGANEYAIDIVLRGDRETPFFDDWD
jgi:protocatechuate 3,4-dioxygenase beta subunit